VINNIGKYGCDSCQRIKNRIEVPVEKLKLSKILEKPWIHMIVDFIMKLSLVARKVARKDTILVVCNRLSKMAHFVVIIEETLAEGLV